MPRKKKAKEEEVYHVEVITKARVSEGDWEYLVKWAGYDSDADSWEPAENVRQCHRLLASFWKHIGTDDEDYPVGYVVEAQESWISKEKRYFAETFAKPSKRKSDSRTKKEGAQSESSVSKTNQDDSQSSEEDSSVRAPVKKLGKKVRVVDTESEVEFESDNQSHEEAKACPRVAAPSSKEPPKGAQVKQREMLSTASSSLPIPPPKVAVVRTHQDQRTNPLVKSMDLPTRSLEAGSSLSTKQRIAAGILPPPTGPKPLTSGPKKSLSSLSFKKNKPPVPSAIQTKDIARPSTSIAVPAPNGQTEDATTPDAPVFSPTSPIAQPPNITENTEVVASPQLMDIDFMDFVDTTFDEPGPLSAGPEIPTVHIPLKSQKEINAEEFLKTVNIPLLSGPLEVDPVADESDEHQTTELPKALAIPKIPKKWKWSGDLFISTSESKTELLCAVTIADPKGICNSSHINLLLSPLDSLQILKLYPIMDLSPLLRACGKPQYFGWLEPNEPSEEATISGLRHYLTHEGLAAAIPLLLDGTQVALLVVFSRAQEKLTKVLQVPEHLLPGTPLLVVLLPFLVSIMSPNKIAGYRSIETVQQASYNLQDMHHDFSQEVVLHQAMSLLCFPKVLFDFFNNSPTSRPYCIWPTPDQLCPELDTTLLQLILRSTKAVPAKLEDDVRAIFIPNRCLEILHTMSTLVSKCVNSPEIQFWTYGFAIDMACKRWGVHEIYPLGGIVTFTPSALVEDLVGCHQLMAQIIEHPLWDCHLIPDVLAVSHLLCNNGNPSPPSESCLGPILDLVNLGSISVTRMPQKGNSDQVAWLSQIFDPSGDEPLEVFLEALKSQHITSGMTTEQLITFTNNEIVKELSNAQIQPALMENYRRFVVIRATSEDATPWDGCGLEWSPLSEFNFKDDYFQP